MWALKINDGYKRIKAKGITVDGIQYPANIFKVWSHAELKELGIVPLREVKPSRDPMFHIDGPQSIEVKDDEVVITHSIKSREVEDIKKTLKEKINTQLFSILSQTDWSIIRAYETEVALPDHIVSLRNDTRKAAQDMKDSVKTATTVQELENLKVTRTEKGEQHGLLFDWPNEEDYPKA
jgi:hypothetical protein